MSARKYAVLYVDDDPTNLQLVEQIMELRPDVELFCVLSGRQGLSMAGERHLDLVLLDLDMPDLPGDEVLRVLKAEGATREIPVVMFSADVNPAQKRKLLALGAQDYVTKPVHVREFLDLIDTRLRATFEERCQVDP